MLPPSTPAQRMFFRHPSDSSGKSSRWWAPRDSSRASAPRITASAAVSMARRLRACSNRRSGEAPGVASFPARSSRLLSFASPSRRPSPERTMPARAPTRARPPPRRGGAGGSNLPGPLLEAPELREPLAQAVAGAHDAGVDPDEITQLVDEL